MAKEITYGCFHGGDPREFTPDPECCTETEIANWKRDCEAWDRGETTEVPVSGWTSPTVHVMRSAYGLGTYYVEFGDESAEQERNRSQK